MPGIADLDEETRKERFAAAVQLLEALSLWDGAEGLLAAQMVACHQAAMDCMQKQKAQLTNQTFEGRHENLKQAQRFLGMYIKQMQHSTNIAIGVNKS